MNQSAIVSLLLAGGANVNLKSQDVNPAVFLAIDRHPNLLGELLRAGVDPNLTDTKGVPLLYLAVAKAWSAGWMQRDFKNGSYVPGDAASRSTLEADWLAIVRQLLEKGANVNAGWMLNLNNAENFTTPLFLAVGTRDSELVGLLLENGADPNLGMGFAPSVGGGGSAFQPALQHAVATGGLPLVELLLKYKANPNAKSAVGDTALNKAVTLGEVGIVGALLKGGADPNLADAAGQSPLAYACAQLSGFPDKKLHDEQAGQIQQAVQPATGRSSSTTRTPQKLGEDWLQMIRLLLAHGAKVDIALSAQTKVAPLHYGAAYRNDLLQLLLAAKASVSITNQFGHTPLFSAASANRPEAIRLLVAAGAEINAADIKGNTPLHLAVMRDSLEAAQVLLDLGADKSATNKAGQSPAHYAISFPAPGMPTVFDQVALPDYERSAVTGPRLVDMNSKRRVADLFKDK